MHGDEAWRESLVKVDLSVARNCGPTTPNCLLQTCVARAFAIALVLFLPSPCRAEEPPSLRVLLGLTAITTGIGPDQVVDFLALAEVANDAEPHLVRWDQETVTLGLIVSEDAPTELVQEVVADVEAAFKYVHRKLDVCIRSGAQRPEAFVNQERSIKTCEARETEIDLVVDFSATSILENAHTSQLPSKSENVFLKRYWNAARKISVTQPHAGICDVGIATDVDAQRISGAGGMIRAANFRQNALPLLKKCSTELGYLLLGATHLREPNEVGRGVVSPVLLRLLYSNDFQSGESRTSVANKIRRAMQVN